MTKPAKSWEKDYIFLLNWFSNLPVREVWHFEKMMVETRKLFQTQRQEIIKQVKRLKKPNVSRVCYAVAEPIGLFLKKRHKKEGFNQAINEALKAVREL